MIYESFNALTSMLRSYESCISYTPLSGEIDYLAVPFFKHFLSSTFMLPPDKHTDPFKWAEYCSQLNSDIETFIVVPGKIFDVYGTRHGHGQGWYDRFLSKIPTHWVRIGMCYEEQLSQRKILKEPWDEPVDWIITFNPVENVWNVIKTSARLNTT